VTTAEKDNAPPDYVANDEEACRGEFIKVSVNPDGKSYSVSIPAKRPPKLPGKIVDSEVTDGLSSSRSNEQSSRRHWRHVWNRTRDCSWTRGSRSRRDTDFRRKEQVAEAVSAIEARGKHSLEIVSDVSDKSSLEALLNKCIERFGKVDILVNSAGKTKRTATVDVAEDEWNNILDTNVSGTLRRARCSVVTCSDASMDESSTLPRFPHS